MYDIKQLEDEWKKYKSKSRRPLYVIVIIIFIILSIILIFNKNKIDFPIFKQSIDYFKTVTPSVKNKDRVLVLNEGLQVLETKISITSSEVDSVDSLVDIPILDVEEEKIISTDSKSRKKIHLDIVETSSITAYEDVEKRFLQSRDIDDALFLAKSYYKRSNYEKAAYWALEVNKLDQNLEESVLIFVESKVRLGQKNEATLLLKNYLKKSHSEAGNILLDKIENDTLD